MTITWKVTTAAVDSRINRQDHAQRRMHTNNVTLLTESCPQLLAKVLAAACHQQYTAVTHIKTLKPSGSLSPATSAETLLPDL
jgi:hypothetical protein